MQYSPDNGKTEIHNNSCWSRQTWFCACRFWFDHTGHISCTAGKRLKAFRNILYYKPDGHLRSDLGLWTNTWVNNENRYEALRYELPETDTREIKTRIGRQGSTGQIKRTWGTDHDSLTRESVPSCCNRKPIGTRTKSTNGHKYRKKEWRKKVMLTGCSVHMIHTTLLRTMK